MINKLTKSNSKNQQSKPPTTPWRYLLIIVLVISISFRFANLENKVFWWDEVINSIHSSGSSIQKTYSQIEMWQGQEIEVQKIRSLQYPNPKSNSLDVIKTLAKKEPQSPPLYYLLSRWWTQLFGFSVPVQRSLSIFLSLLAFPCVYWLCLELFSSYLAAYIGVILFAVSPFHLIFAQEVRMYGVWTVAIVLCNLFFLRAIRLQQVKDWVLYSCSLILSLYIFPLSLLCVISQGIYLASTSFFSFNKKEKSKILKAKKDSNRNFISYLTALTASLIIYTPWILFLLQINETKMALWRQRSIPLSDLFKNWILQTSMIVADLNPKYLGGSGDAGLVDTFFNPLSFYPMIIVWIIIIYSAYYLIYNSPSSIRLFILSSILVPAFIFACPDLITGGIRSTVARYSIPFYFGLQLMLVNFIYKFIETYPLHRLKQKIGLLFFGILLTFGIFSSGLIARHDSWWNKSFNYQNIPIANIINSSGSTLLITPQSNWIHAISLSNNLNDKVEIMFVNQPFINQKISNFKNKYLFNYSKKWLDTIKDDTNIKLKKVYENNLLAKDNPNVNFSLVHIKSH